MIKLKKFFTFVFLSTMVLSCSTGDSEDSPSIEDVTLAANLVNKEFVIDNVIACAASNENPSLTSVFLYPRDGVTNIDYYYTNSLDVDKNDYTAYVRGDADLINVFNGFLLKYEIAPIQEQWVIVVFEENGIINLSNPIRIKHLSKPTEYLPENVAINATTTMPIFDWEDGSFDDSVIYFQAVLTENNDKSFQFYNLDNVVLNITEEQPPSLEEGLNYGFTLLAVSEDNWVNLFAERTFKIN